MKQIKDSMKADPVYTSLTRSYKVEQIKDGTKTDSEIYFIYGVNCEMKQIKDSLKLIP